MPGPAPPPAAPSRARHWVIVFAVTLAVIQYIDRVCISQSKPLIAADLHLSTKQMGWVFSAFTLAYALFEIPCGYLGDLIGPRRVLMRIVLWWSFFTAATGWATSWLSLVLTRFLFGAGEAGCFPNLSNAFNRWLPSGERGRAQGLMWMSTRWGGALTPPLVYLCVQHMRWRTTFMLFGLLGVVWAVVFFLWFRDNPREHPQVNAAEAALLPAPAPASEPLQVPWRKMARSKTVWCLCGQYFAISYVWTFFVTWYPSYLLSPLGIDPKRSALLAGAPLLLGGFGALGAGWLLPILSRGPGGARSARRGLGAGGLGTGAVLLVLAPQIGRPYAAVLVIALVGFCNDVATPAAWTACMDVGGRFVATLGGTMNMLGNLGGFLSPLVVGYLVDEKSAPEVLRTQWPVTFYLMAAVYALGAACWLFLDPVTPLEQQVSD